MRYLVIGTFFAALVFGCSVKQEAKFEKVTGQICTTARDLQAVIALGQAVAPGDDVPYAIGLSYRQVLNVCDERDAYYETYPPES